MRFCEFTEKIKTELELLCGETYQIQLEEIEKNNGLKMVGVLCKKEGNAYGSVIYLESYYLKYCSGKISLPDIILEIKELIGDQPGIESLRRKLLDFQSVKERLRFRLVNREMNQARLEQIPYIEYLDLAVVFYIEIEDTENGCFSIMVRKVLAEKWGVTEKDLYAAALENMQRQFPPVIELLDDIMFRMLDEMLEDNESKMEELCIPAMEVPLHVVTNKRGLWGAGTILYPGVLKELADKLETDLFLIPSSVHEILAWQYKEDADVVELKGMVEYVNQHDVKEDDVLSNNLYRYRRDKDCVELLMEN